MILISSRRSSTIISAGVSLLLAICSNQGMKST